MNAKTVIAFLAGAAVGSFVTWKYIQKKAEPIYTYTEDFTEEETESEEPVRDEQVSFKFEKPDIMEYAAKIKEAKYAIEAFDKEHEEKGGVEPMDHAKPYIISPDDFGEEDEYETVTLFYHGDGRLTNTMHEPVENIDETIGADFADHFGEYEDDSVFVRNDDLRTDFEILFDPIEIDESEPEPHADEE